MGFGKDLGEDGQRIFIWGEPHFPLENGAIGLEVKAVHQLLSAAGEWKNAGKSWQAGHFTIDAGTLIDPATFALAAEGEGLVSALLLFMAATPESMGKTAQDTIYSCVSAWVDKFIQANTSQVDLTE